MRPNRITIAGIVTLAATAAVVATTGVGTAARQVAPENTSPPTISGTPAEGQTLTATTGEWTGTSPTFSYQWRRCDAQGGSCSSISGATEKTYTLKSVDRDNTLRIVVTAKNADGSRSATSVPTGVVKGTAAQPVTGCPTDKSLASIDVDQVTPPARLSIVGQELSPSPVSRSSQGLTARFRVTACDGKPVQGALVYVTAVPYNQFSVPSEIETGLDGWAQLTMRRLDGFPAADKQQLVVMFVRARKASENPLGGISTRRLVSFPLR